MAPQHLKVHSNRNAQRQSSARRSSVSGVSWLVCGALILALSGSGGEITAFLLPVLPVLSLLGVGMLLMGYHRLKTSPRGPDI